MESAGTLPEGAIFAGHRIEGILGRGGMGVVYSATHLALDAPRALKVIAPHLAREDEFRERFRREAQLAASLQHPHVVAIHDTGEQDGVLYISMQRIEGTDLAELIARSGRLDPVEAVELLAHVGDALDAAHERGLVHRDVKPANVLVEDGARGRRAYATDFGLTKPAAAKSGFTETGIAVGSIDYMAPEQFTGAPLDARTDVYAMGAVYFSALTGSVPFPGDNPMQKMFGHTQREAPSIRDHVPDLPEALARVVAAALAKDPADRQQSAGDLGRAARAALEGDERGQSVGSVATGAAAGLAATQPLSIEDAAPPAPPRRPLPPTSRMPVPEPSSSRRGLVVAGIILAVAGAAAAGFLIAGSGDDGPRRVINITGPEQDEDSGGGDERAAALEFSSYSPSTPGFDYRAEIPVGGGWGAPVEDELTPGRLLRTTLKGPDGLVLSIDHTPDDVPSFGYEADSQASVDHPVFGVATEYVFSNNDQFEQCAVTSCIDIQVDDGAGGGWAVLAGGAADFGLAEDVARRVADSVGF